jgi:transcriptional regulator with XRE-family HTH domain
LPFPGIDSVRRIEDSAIPGVLAEVGPRLKRLRTRRGLTLTAVAALTGISKSTLSRLESGQRKPSLELLLPLGEAYRVPLDELVGAPEVGDPRIRLKPRNRNGRLVFPLTQQSSGVQVWKVVIPPQRDRELRVHKGYEWLYVLSGQLRLILGEHDITMGPVRSPSSTPSSHTGSARQVTSRSRS